MQSLFTEHKLQITNYSILENAKEMIKVPVSSSDGAPGQTSLSLDMGEEEILETLSDNQNKPQEYR